MIRQRAGRKTLNILDLVLKARRKVILRTSKWMVRPRKKNQFLNSDCKPQGMHSGNGSMNRVASRPPASLCRQTDEDS